MRWQYASPVCTAVSEVTPNLTVAFAAMIGFGLLVVAVITTTSFVKVSVVLFLLRNALGVQQSPPNIVLYTIALILTAFVSLPLFRAEYQILTDSAGARQSIEEWREIAVQMQEPLKAQLLRFTPQAERDFFLDAAARMWPADMRTPDMSESLPVLVPAYLIGELRRAFEIGFLLYLPFVVVDLVITTILIAMGMSQVQPTTIAVPLKLLLFVLVEGWTRLLHGLVLSYAI